MRVMSSSGQRRRARGVVALALALTAMAATVPLLAATAGAQVPEPCPPDSVYVDMVFSGDTGPKQIEINAENRWKLYFLDNYGQSVLEWSIGSSTHNAYFRAASLGSATGGHQMSAARFDLIATSAGASGTAMVVARLDLATHLEDFFWRGTTVTPAGELLGRLLTPAGVVDWHATATTTGDFPYRLESQPFEVSVGSPFDVRWETGFHHVRGRIAITGQLTLATFGDPNVQIRDCAGTSMTLTPTRATTWGGIKALFR